MEEELKVEIDWKLYQELKRIGIIQPQENSTNSFNIGKSDYSKHLIQPWHIWVCYNLNPWDADIIKRVLRTKEGESRVTDYEKIIHVCQERIRQLNVNNDTK